MTKPDVEIDPAVEEPPALAFVRDYWWRCKGDRPVPRRSDIQPSQMKAYLPSILLADVIDGGNDFRYRLIGSRLHDYFGGNPTGLLMSESLHRFGSDTVTRTLDAYRNVIARGEPVRVRGSGLVFAQGLKLFDALLTPLAGDDGAVTMIFGTFTFVWDKDREHGFSLRQTPDETELNKLLGNEQAPFRTRPG